MLVVGAAGNPWEILSSLQTTNAHQLDEVVEVIREAARALELLDQPRHTGVDREPQMTDRMHEQHAIGADRQLVHEAGFAQDHRRWTENAPPSATASWLLKS